jgi:hypothetical protein
MKQLILACSLLAVPTLAHADEAIETRDAYLSTSVIAGADHFVFGGLAAEAGRRISGTPVYLRAMIHTGEITAFTDGEGSYLQGRVGGELRECRVRGIFCGSVGLDLGIHHSKHVEEDRMTERHDNLVVAPRVAVDVGGRVRLRGAFEVVRHVGGDDVTGAAATLGLGVTF